MSDDIYHEIQEDLRQQQLKAFWAENGSWIIGGVIAAVIFTGVLSFWRDYEAKAHMWATAGLLAAQESADPAKLEGYAAEAPRSHAVLALFDEAALYTGRGQQDKAAEVYAKIADMSRIDRRWRDLAKLYGAAARLDRGAPAQLHEELAALEDKKNPWRWTALELDALLFARENKPEDAAKTLAVLIADPNAPAEIRARATTLRGLYAAGGKKDAATGGQKG